MEARAGPGAGCQRPGRRGRGRGGGGGQAAAGPWLPRPRRRPGDRPRGGHRRPRHVRGPGRRLGSLGAARLRPRALGAARGRHGARGRPRGPGRAQRHRVRTGPAGGEGHRDPPPGAAFEGCEHAREGGLAVGAGSALRRPGSGRARRCVATRHHGPPFPLPQPAQVRPPRPAPVPHLGRCRVARPRRAHRRAGRRRGGRRLAGRLPRPVGCGRRRAPRHGAAAGDRHALGRGPLRARRLLRAAAP
mmetsp:Transcript_23166/g.71872  ORF Transcript_23166/g.71872 Transcript_23166/m.71872 type:complete len:246 (+) Transcript_23166:1070-1807(+)